MRLTKLRLRNWKNFSDTGEVPLSPRVFLVGNNGIGKSNLLNALRFLHDIANPDGGGLRSALKNQGEMKQIRYFSSRTYPTVDITVWAKEEKSETNVDWCYHLSLHQETAGKRRVLIKEERVWKNDDEVLSRPDQEDNDDSDRLTQTALQQTNYNKRFREVAKFFESFKYIHIVPQLIRHGAEMQGKVLPDDPFGQDLMDAIAKCNKKTRNSRITRIEHSLQRIKPSFASEKLNLEFDRDQTTGEPHLYFTYPSWHRYGRRQTEEILSDGELRLVGLLWTLLENNPVILLEEPELSFNEGIVAHLPNLFADIIETKKKRRSAQQIIMSTHSTALLSDPDIKSNEVLLLSQANETTKIEPASSRDDIHTEMSNGIPASRSVLRYAQSDLLRDFFS